MVFLAGATAGDAMASVVSARPAQSPADVRDYWTPQRMRDATPPQPLPSGSRQERADDVSAASAGYPGRVHGKVFFTVAAGDAPGDYVCSGTVVNSNSHSLVWTAGHCVNDAENGGGFATNWVFVPGYRTGSAPFGEWPAKRLETTSGWRSTASVRVDLGAATLARDAQGRGIEDAVGARAIAFGQPRPSSVTAFGYPTSPSLFQPLFDGERLFSCDAPVTGTDSPAGAGPAPIEIECDMSAGSSGGGWVTADGAVAGLTSYGYATDVVHLYGPYFGSVARELYEQASGPPLLCAGAPITNLGGPGADTFGGAGGADAFRLAGGADRAAGTRGNDTVCGGGGDDRLVGGPGADILVGGPGADTCIGGPGTDRATGCERLRRIP